MARRRRRRNEDRDAIDVASEISLAPRAVQRAVVRSVQDRRFFDPSRRHALPRGVFVDDNRLEVRRVRRIPVIPGRFSRSKVVSSKARSLGGARKIRKRSSVWRERIAVPQRVALCVRRKERRETLFALGRTGSGARSRKHRNIFSDVRC